jgi:hypothetical protein
MSTLKAILRANAASCIVFGLIFLLIPTKVAVFLAQSSPIPTPVLTFLGAALVLNGLHLVWASLQASPNNYLIIYFAIGDFIWVLASISLIFMELWITTQSGIIASVIVGAMVGMFGILQMIHRDG